MLLLGAAIVVVTLLVAAGGVLAFVLNTADSAPPLLTTVPLAEPYTRKIAPSLVEPSSCLYAPTTRSS